MCYVWQQKIKIYQDLAKEQEATGILSSLGIKTRLSKIPLLRDILF